MNFALLLAATLLPASVFVAAQAQKHSTEATHLAAPEELHCEGSKNPLAVSASRPRLSWQLISADRVAHGVSQSAYRIEVARSLQALTDENRLLWKSGKVNVAPGALSAATYDGPALEPGHAYWWRVRAWDEKNHASSWSHAAHWIAAPQWQAPWIAAQSTDALAGRLPMPLLRKSFSLPSSVHAAVLHISGLGQYEAHLNGAKIGTSELAPGWSDFRKTDYYDSYDVTALLHPGQNALGVLLGNGMFRVQRTKGRYTKLEASYGPPELTAQLHIELADGHTIDLTTDASWKTAPGPIIFSSIYGGEDYDARREVAGWDTANFNDAQWSSAVVVPGPGGALRPEAAPPIGIFNHYAPVHNAEVKPGVEVYDLGQNFAGWPAITVDGPVDATVKLIPGELINKDGTVSQQSSGKPQWFTYTLKGVGTERWHPRFSYTGFRYVQVELAGGARLLSIEGQAVHSTSPSTGSFASSNPLLNRIHALILRAIENNAESLLTDCPHREKLGWLEQTHLLAPSILYDFEFSGIYAALGQNIADAQKPSGMVPEIAPQYVTFDEKWGPYNDSPEWGSAAVLAPWQLYKRTGNVEALVAQREVMRRYVDYLGTRAVDGIVSYGLGDWYDIGPGEPGFSKLTSAGVTATAIYYEDLCVLARVMNLAGDAASSAHYAELATKVRAAFNTRFFSPAQHRYDRGSQTAQAMPLALGMVPEGEREAVLDALIADIHAHSDHITAGDIGYHYLIEALYKAGRSDVLYATLKRTDAPSYAYQLAQGATALTEAWDANPAHSQDHFMLGDAEEWLYRGLGGIDIDFSAGPEQELSIQPVTAGDLTWVQTRYNSVWGTIESGWSKKHASTEYNLALPVNARARAVIETANPALVLVNGLPPSRAAGVVKSTISKDRIELVLGSGKYLIVAANHTAEQIAVKP